LAVFKKSLFEASFHAGVHGSIIPQLYREYEVFSWMPIKKDIGEEYINSFKSKFNKEEKSLLEDITKEYFGLSAYELELTVHNESP
jgi:uncharacterized phage-associated protein